MNCSHSDNSSSICLAFGLSFFFGCFVSECVRRVRPVPERAVRSKELGQPGPGHHWRPGASAESHSLREYVYRVPQTHTHTHTHVYTYIYIYNTHTHNQEEESKEHHPRLDKFPILGMLCAGGIPITFGNAKRELVCFLISTR